MRLLPLFLILFAVQTVILKAHVLKDPKSNLLNQHDETGEHKVSTTENTDHRYVGKGYGPIEKQLVDIPNENIPLIQNEVPIKSSSNGYFGRMMSGAKEKLQKGKEALKSISASVSESAGTLGGKVKTLTRSFSDGVQKLGDEMKSIPNSMSQKITKFNDKIKEFPTKLFDGVGNLKEKMKNSLPFNNGKNNEKVENFSIAMIKEVGKPDQKSEGFKGKVTAALSRFSDTFKKGITLIKNKFKSTPNNNSQELAIINEKSNGISKSLKDKIKSFPEFINKGMTTFTGKVKQIPQALSKGAVKLKDTIKKIPGKVSTGLSSFGVNAKSVMNKVFQRISLVKEKSKNIIQPKVMQSMNYVGQKAKVISNITSKGLGAAGGKLQEGASYLNQKKNTLVDFVKEKKDKLTETTSKGADYVIQGFSDGISKFSFGFSKVFEKFLYLGKIGSQIIMNLPAILLSLVAIIIIFKFSGIITILFQIFIKVLFGSLSIFGKYGFLPALRMVGSKVKENMKSRFSAELEENEEEEVKTEEKKKYSKKHRREKEIIEEEPNYEEEEQEIFTKKGKTKEVPIKVTNQIFIKFENRPRCQKELPHCRSTRRFSRYSRSHLYQRARMSHRHSHLKNEAEDMKSLEELLQGRNVTISTSTLRN